MSTTPTLPSLEREALLEERRAIVSRLAKIDEEYANLMTRQRDIDARLAVLRGEPGPTP